MYVYVEFQLKTFTQFLFWNTINQTLPECTMLNFLDAISGFAGVQGCKLWS